MQTSVVTGSSIAISFEGLVHCDWTTWISGNFILPGNRPLHLNKEVIWSLLQEQPKEMLTNLMKTLFIIVYSVQCDLVAKISWTEMLKGKIKSIMY